MKHLESERTLVTLANASELVISITQNVVGNDIADTFNGSPLSRELIHSLAQTSFRAAINKSTGV